MSVAFVLFTAAGAVLVPPVDAPPAEVPIVVEIAPCTDCVPAEPTGDLAGTGLAVAVPVTVGMLGLGVGVGIAIAVGAGPRRVSTAMVGDVPPARASRGGSADSSGALR